MPNCIKENIHHWDFCHGITSEFCLIFHVFAFLGITFIGLHLSAFGLVTCNWLLHISVSSCSQSRRGGARGGRARGRGRGRGQGQGQGRGRGQVQGQGQGQVQGRGREKNQAVEMSVDELNDDLDNYHAGAKHTWEFSSRRTVLWN